MIGEKFKNMQDSIRYDYNEAKERFPDVCVGCPKLVSFYANNELAELCCDNHTCQVWIKSHPIRKTVKIRILTINEWKKKIYREEENANPCAGCKFRKYHDCGEPTLIGFRQHYYDCENPACPNWERLWWRNKNDGSYLLDQEPIMLKRKFQHATYKFVEKLNNIICILLDIVRYV